MSIAQALKISTVQKPLHFLKFIDTITRNDVA